MITLSLSKGELIEERQSHHGVQQFQSCAKLALYRAWYACDLLRQGLVLVIVSCEDGLSSSC